jgi:hypothetical protein
VLDCLAVYRDRVVAISHRVGEARPPALGDEVSRKVDVAVGPSFRGAGLRPSPTLTLSLFLFFADMMFIRISLDRGRIGHHPQCVHTSFFCWFFRFSVAPRAS